MASAGNCAGDVSVASERDLFSHYSVKDGWVFLSTLPRLITLILNSERWGPEQRLALSATDAQKLSGAISTRRWSPFACRSSEKSSGSRQGMSHRAYEALSSCHANEHKHKSLSALAVGI
jgi:hypothetical protein